STATAAFYRPSGGLTSDDRRSGRSPPLEGPSLTNITVDFSHRQRYTESLLGNSRPRSPPGCHHPGNGLEEGSSPPLPGGRGVTMRVLSGHQGLVRCVGYAADGRTLASTGDDTTIKLWDPAAGQERAVLRGHTGPVHGLAF